MQLHEFKPLALHTSLRLGGEARYFCEVTTLEDMRRVFQKATELEVEPFFLGGGSNTFFADGVINKLVVKNKLVGTSFQEEDGKVVATVAAGENWDEFVRAAVANRFSGVEALSGIPGTVGAAPVQNIGAYGSELSDIFISLTAWDRKNKELKQFDHKDCAFGYRTSLFKEQSNRFFITAVKLRLKQNKTPKIPQYGSLQAYLEKQNITNPTILEIREAVLAVRSMRLPDIKNQPNAGSFFVNPVISKDQADALQKKFPQLVRYDLENGKVKIPAGWLIEQAGLKGEQFGNFHTSADNALVLIHDGDGTTKELLVTEETIKERIRDTFGITLEREPNLVM